MQQSVAGVKGGGSGGRCADSGKEAVPQAAGPGREPPAPWARSHARSQQRPWDRALLPLSCWASSLTASPGATSFLPAQPPTLLLPTALACHPVAPRLER